MTEQRRIITLNNHGVRLLQQRNHRQASQSMLQALNHLKESIKKRPLPGTHEKIALVSEDCHEDIQERPSHFSIHPISSSSVTASTSQSSFGREDSRSSLPFQMFDRVFSFNATANHDPIALHNRDGASAALLYNLGAVHHARGMDLNASEAHPKAAALSFSKALRMYTWALSAIQHWARHYNVHQGCHVLRLAILNNMAHVNALMHKKGAAQHCLKCLRDILSYAKGHTSPQEYAFFSANVVVLCLKGGDGNLVVAPAAAA